MLIPPIRRLGGPHTDSILVPRKQPEFMRIVSLLRYCEVAGYFHHHQAGDVLYTIKTLSSKRIRGVGPLEAWELNEI